MFRLQGSRVGGLNPKDYFNRLNTPHATNPTTIHSRKVASGTGNYNRRLANSLQSHYERGTSLIEDKAEMHVNSMAKKRRIQFEESSSSSRSNNHEESKKKKIPSYIPEPEKREMKRVQEKRESFESWRNSDESNTTLTPQQKAAETRKRRKIEAEFARKYIPHPSTSEEPFFIPSLNSRTGVEQVPVSSSVAVPTVSSPASSAATPPPPQKLKGQRESSKKKKTSTTTTTSSSKSNNIPSPSDPPPPLSSLPPIQEEEKKEDKPPKPKPKPKKSNTKKPVAVKKTMPQRLTRPQNKDLDDHVSSSVDMDIDF